MQHHMGQLTTVLHASFDAGAPAIRSARNAVGEALVRQGWNTSDVDRARLVVSELAANAVLHARTRFEVDCAVDDGARISVTDWEPARLPEPRDLDPSTPGGLGIRLVDELVDEWGVDRHDDCKVVWCHLCKTVGEVARRAE
jgi:anti-sigma regulatory factor (Ser/Thr protein kinase)